ncbi:MAG: hypothetical protein ACJAVA_000159 [Flavobacteriaceae bacterium]|jgi:hypothetical protein
MKNKEFVSRVSNQLKMLSKDDYISDRYILSVGNTIATKFITQKIQTRSIDRDLSLYKEVACIEFEPKNIFECKYVEFKSCKTLYKSKKTLKELGLVFTRYGSSIKELYSIDRIFTVFTESTLYQLRLDSQRDGVNNISDRFYILDGYIYITQEIEVLSGLILAIDQYELDNFSSCTENCKSAWEYDFIAPDSLLEDIIGYTLQQVSMPKGISTDEKPNLNSNDK